VFGFVKLADGTKHTVVSEIHRKVATRLASYKVPEGLEVLDEMPRSALSKVDRKMLQAMASRAAGTGSQQIAGVPARQTRPDERPMRRAARNS
jgi:long-chain acyl-CoA synthetase